ncbi:MAG: YidC/Oxa1 family insertase periplasmic-domain containing protein [candidate division WOR-3 bacterium]
MSSDSLRMIIGFALIMVILILWQVLLPQRRQPVSQPQPAPAVGEPETVAVAAVLKPAEFIVPETTFFLENQFLRLELSSRGGAIKSCYLKKYSVQLVPEKQTILGTEEISHLPPTGFNLSESTVAFSYLTSEGILTKTWKLGGDYSLDLILELPGENTVLTFDARAGINLTENNVKEDLANFHFYAHNQGKIHQIAANSLRKKPFVTAADWVGLKSKYFFLALVSKDSRFDSCRAEVLDDGRIGFKAEVRAAGKEKGFLVYLGPVEYNRLKSFGLGFENVVSLGWLKPIALGILYLLRLFFTIVRNWGGAIVLFSILMKVAFYPLTRTQTRQMRQLQLLQPKIEELKKKYKNDPQTLNQETMRLYQMYKVNPVSGCLPLLVQMPVFFALYTVLRNFIELRGAGFILWLKDLSQPDTLFGHLPSGIPLVGGFAIGLLPILMGASFIAQNLLTATDKRNWAMTIIFPIFITAIFLNLSSGLQLYWFIYNILSIWESLIATKGGVIWQRFRKTPNLGVS